MKPILKIEAYSVHLWQVYIPDLLPKIHDFTLLLDEIEMKRAKRFHFEIHRQRFIIARAVLRRILSIYTGIPPQNLVFTVGPRGKPYLSPNPLDLQFNISHSEGMAVYAMTSHVEIGIDIEKIEPRFNEEVAKRFFSSKEYAELMALPELERIPAFYRLWAGKESVIKALGEGLFVPLSDFSLDVSKSNQTIEFTHQGSTSSYYVEHFSARPGYQAALASSEQIKNVVFCDYSRY